MHVYKYLLFTYKYIKMRYIIKTTKITLLNRRENCLFGWHLFLSILKFLITQISFNNQIKAKYCMFRCCYFSFSRGTYQRQVFVCKAFYIVCEKVLKGLCDNIFQYVNQRNFCVNQFVQIFYTWVQGCYKWLWGPLDGGALYGQILVVDQCRPPRVVYSLFVIMAGNFFFKIGLFISIGHILNYRYYIVDYVSCNFVNVNKNFK
eukprot:TRINITY_DN4713_c1_g1_i5.p1 TRINITY_DN4713_c1_g1~~TRINITY_DN4713_c1_g1_i5.p1  ORF type:complete len:204 (+),score=-19.60 TRINITY_DN4713_c1_g1_i5:103-714(+)